MKPELGLIHRRYLLEGKSQDIGPILGVLKGNGANISVFIEIEQRVLIQFSSLYYAIFP